MRNNFKILTICRQPLRNVQYAVRAYNLYKHLERMGCRMTYLDGWKPSFGLNLKNSSNWIKLFLFRMKATKNSFVFVEDVQSSVFAKILKKMEFSLILDVRDDLNLHAEAMGIKVPYSGYLERELAQVVWFEAAQRILVTSQSYLDYYSQKYQGQFDQKLIPILNASDPAWFQNEPLPQGPRIGILGGANLSAGFDLLCEASKIVKKEVPDLSLHIGYKYLPETKPYVESLRRDYNESWMHFYEDIDYDKNANEFYSSLYLCIIPLKKLKHYELTIPCRLFDAMASARPLVVTNCKEQARVVTEENCGLVCEFTPEDMAEKILILLRNRSLAQKQGQSGRRAIEEQHSWLHRAQKIIKNI